ncbi:late embryogenesis abundant (LEA) hydroxyproline-rich glycoprotein family [Actinidia rufa]|uniref:Late embryogenesis abundant (LEA) hydroxyproline-rich glycoprotein family n=1 Tax=Actinidia rufa TaxID=165716 RepID=A0A7J0DN41_9ERIC|nr:late embryogenesis abundant (LEA) hydroxyproline-rich glycoprotein family [Actinidia rufa]
MAEKEHVKPLAPASVRPSSDDEEAALYLKKIHQKKCIKCCGCVLAFLLIQIIVVIILIFTVFKVKDPVINLNGVTVEKIDLIEGTTTPRPGSNMTLMTDVSVKNPNVASFKYGNTTTTLYYRGTVIGEARGPPGSLKSDMGNGILPMTSFTRVGGRVKMLIIKRHVVVKMNCTMTINITSRAIQEQKCKRKVKL